MNQSSLSAIYLWRAQVIFLMELTSVNSPIVLRSVGECDPRAARYEREAHQWSDAHLSKVHTRLIGDCVSSREWFGKLLTQIEAWVQLSKFARILIMGSSLNLVY